MWNNDRSRGTTPSPWAGRVSTFLKSFVLFRSVSSRERTIILRNTSITWAVIVPTFLKRSFGSVTFVRFHYVRMVPLRSFGSITFVRFHYVRSVPLRSFGSIMFVRFHYFRSVPFCSFPWKNNRFQRTTPSPIPAETVHALLFLQLDPPE